MNTSTKSIAELAHELWDARGRPQGSPERDWIEAERLVAHSATERASDSKNVDEALAESFPASDPPASHIPDLPPSNADAKWTAARRKKSSRDRK
jgi:hypothetical protein